MLALYQAEWCPYSSAVRERLTELGIDFVARQVEPGPSERRSVDEIPTLETEDGVRLAGTGPIFEYLRTLDDGRYEREHRQRYDEHESERREGKTASILRDEAPLSGA
jgi:glutathione S-transferase